MKDIWIKEWDFDENELRRLRIETRKRHSIHFAEDEDNRWEVWHDNCLYNSYATRDEAEKYVADECASTPLYSYIADRVEAVEQKARALDIGFPVEVAIREILNGWEDIAVPADDMDAMRSLVVKLKKAYEGLDRIRDLLPSMLEQVLVGDDGPRL